MGSLASILPNIYDGDISYFNNDFILRTNVSAPMRILKEVYYQESSALVRSSFNAILELYAILNKFFKLLDGNKKCHDKLNKEARVYKEKEIEIETLQNARRNLYNRLEIYSVILFGKNKIWPSVLFETGVFYII